MVIYDSRGIDVVKILKIYTMEFRYLDIYITFSVGQQPMVGVEECQHPTRSRALSLSHPQ